MIILLCLKKIIFHLNCVINYIIIFSKLLHGGLYRRTERDGNGFHENIFRRRVQWETILFLPVHELSAFHPATVNIDVYDKTRFRGVAGKTSLEKPSPGWRPRG